MTRGPTGLRLTAVVVAVAFAAPLAYLVLQNGVDPGGFLGAATSRRALAALGRSLALAAAVSLATAAVGTATAWLVTRTDVPGRRLWALLLPLPLVIPSFIGAFALLAAFGPGGLLARPLAVIGIERLPQIRGFLGAFIVLTLLTFPYVHLVVAARLNQLPPSIEEAGRLFGRTPPAVFTSLVLPQLWPAIGAGTLLVFLYTISDFGAVQLLRYPALTPEIYASRLLDRDLSLALSLLLGLMALAIAGLERLASRKSRLQATGRALRGLHVPLGRWRVLSAGGLLVLVSGSLLAPVVVLLTWAWRGFFGTATGALVSDPTRLLTPTLNTARVSLMAAAVSVAVLLPVALLSVRHRDRLAPATSTIVVAGFALPGLAIALALVYWTVGTPLYQTQTLLVFAYVIHFGAQSLRAGEVAVASVPHRMEEAARVLGAGRWRRLVTVDLPLMAPGLFAGAGLVLLSSMKELPATLLLAPNGFETLATRIWNAAEDAFLADASIASLVLLAVSGVLTWILVIRRSDAL
jgi:iron(III) transport system permease protein